MIPPVAEMPAFAPILTRALVTLWLLAIACGDARTAIIPNQLTLPSMVLFGGWRVLEAGLWVLGTLGVQFDLPIVTQAHLATIRERALPNLLFMLVAWALCFALWELHIVGGGDAKALMGIFALFPTARFAVFLCVAVLLLSLPIMLVKLFGRKDRGYWEAVRTKLTTGSIMPTEQDLESRGQPYAWVFCLPGVVYLWCQW